MKNFRIFFLIGILFIYKMSYCQTPIYKITNIDAHLFYNLNNDFSDKKAAGTFSENIIDNPDFYLWNTIIGEGPAEGPSRQTLIIVKIEGKSNTNETRTIQVICKYDDKTVLKQENEFAIFTKSNVYFYAVLLNDTGCGNLEIIASIINAKTKKTEDNKKAAIDYECGE